MNPAPEAAAYLVAVNSLAFLLFRQDKQAAIAGDRRIPERTLLGLAAIGGSLGAVAAQRVFRHKTRKEPFRTLLRVIIAVQVAAGVALLLLAQR